MTITRRSLFVKIAYCRFLNQDPKSTSAQATTTSTNRIGSSTNKLRKEEPRHWWMVEPCARETRVGAAASTVVVRGFDTFEVGLGILTG
jgi:hypothetical protein